MNFDELFTKYKEEYEQRSAYRNGRLVISESDLLNKLGGELDMLINEYGTLENYAEPDEAGMVLEIFSLREAQFVLKILRDRLS